MKRDETICLVRKSSKFKLSSQFSLGWRFWLVFGAYILWSLYFRAQSIPCHAAIIFLIQIWQKMSTFGMHINTWTSEIIRTFVQTGESHTTPGARPDVRPDVRQGGARVVSSADKKNIWSRRPRLAASIKCDERLFKAGIWRGFSPPAKNQGSCGAAPPSQNFSKKTKYKKIPGTFLTVPYFST